MNLKNKILYIVKELILTFSDGKSLFSSKRIERFAIFSSMLITSIIFLLYRVGNCEKFTSSDLMIVVVGWLGYAGFNVIQSNKNKPEDINENIN